MERTTNMDANENIENKNAEYRARLTAAAGLLRDKGIHTEEGQPLSRFCTFHIGGAGDLCVFPSSEEELTGAVHCLRASGLRFMIAGNGSNLLFDDAGYRGAVIFTSRMKAVRVCGSRIYAECGASLTGTAAAARDAGLSGFEFAYGIPGTVGGGVCMNGGAYGGQISDILTECRLLDTRRGTVLTVPGPLMRFAYRHSLITDRPELCVLGAEFALCPGEREQISGKMEDLMARRVAKQPLEYPSAGSVFRRPAPDIFAGKLIEDAGLKGQTVGGAQVSPKHAGFIVNVGGATAADVKALVSLIQEKIYASSGIRLECEVCFIPAEPGEAE